MSKEMWKVIENKAEKIKRQKQKEEEKRVE